MKKFEDGKIVIGVLPTGNSVIGINNNEFDTIDNALMFEFQPEIGPDGKRTQNVSIQMLPLLPPVIAEKKTRLVGMVGIFFLDPHLSVHSNNISLLLVHL